MSDFRKKFAKIYDANVAKIYRFVFLKVGSREIAEDLTSQVFTKGWKMVRTGADIKNHPAYLYQIARAEISNHYQKSNKFKIISAETVDIIDQTLPIEENQQKQSDFERIKNSLNSLNEESQNILVWRYIDERSIKEIAKMTQKSEGAVRVIIHRALKELRGKLVS